MRLDREQRAGGQLNIAGVHPEPASASIESWDVEEENAARLRDEYREWHQS